MGRRRAPGEGASFRAERASAARNPTRIWRVGLVLGFAWLGARDACADEGASMTSTTANDPARVFGSIPNLNDVNWSDIALKPVVSDGIFYNSNVVGGAPGAPLPKDVSTRGDFYNLIQIGTTPKFYFGQQQLYFDLNYGYTNYLHDTIYNRNQYLISGGLNWTFTSRCTGTVAALDSVSPSSLGQSIGLGVNYVTTTSLTLNGNCKTIGGFSVVANAGAVDVSNSQGLNQANNADTRNLGLGVNYDITGVSSAQLLYNISNTDYLNRGDTAQDLGLADNLLQRELSATYKRQINDNLSASLTGGIDFLTTSPVGGGASRTTTTPTYKAVVTWQATPRFSLGGTFSESAAPATSILANAQISTVEQVVAAYAITPKISATAQLSETQSKASLTELTAPGHPSVTVTTSSTTNSETLSVAYQATPFLTGTLNYTFTEEQGTTSTAPQNIISLSVKYSPY